MTRRPLGHDDLYRLRLASDPQISPDGSRVAFVVTTADREADENRSRIWVAASDGTELVQLSYGDKDSSPRWAPDGRYLAFLRCASGEDEATQVWALPTAGGEARQLTHLALGATGLAWAPDSYRLAVTVLIDLDGEPVDDADRKRRANAPVVVTRGLFKMDGVGLIPNRRVHIHVVDAATGETDQLTKSDLNVSVIDWSPDGTRIAFGATGSDRDIAAQSRVYVIGVDGREPEEVLEWNGTADVPRWSPDGETLLFVGHDRPGSYHARLFTVSVSGGTPTAVAPSFDRNVMVGAPAYPGALPIWMGDGRIVFCARDRGCTHVYSVPSTGGKPTKIVGGEDRVVDGLSLAADSSRIAYVLSTPDVPADVFVSAPDGSNEQRLTWLNRELIDEIALHTPQPRTFTAPDGFELHGWVIRGDGDGAQPLLVDIHGGPHNSWSPIFPATHLYHEILAAHGWSILLLNPRASDGYGEAFFRAAIGAWGMADENDFLSAIDALVDEGLADPDRLAVTGYSYGGYMSNWLVGRTDRFKAAVTGACVSNEASWYGTSDFGSVLDGFEIERELYEAFDRYAELSPLSYVENVGAPVLILHGEEDHRCPIGQAEEWFSSLRRLGRTVQMIRYPDASHQFIDSGRPSHRVDYCRRVVDWVTRYATQTEPV